MFAAGISLHIDKSRHGHAEGVNMLDFSEPRNVACAILVGIGLIQGIITYAAMIVSRKSDKFVSGVPLFGGLCILVGFLISTNRWLAFLALIDPGFWMILAEFLSGKHGNKRK